jgi:hypothetical protein
VGVGVSRCRVKGGHGTGVDPGGGADMCQCCDAARALVLLRAACWSAPMGAASVRYSVVVL